MLRGGGVECEATCVLHSLLSQQLCGTVTTTESKGSAVEEQLSNKIIHPAIKAQLHLSSWSLLGSVWWTSTSRGPVNSTSTQVHGWRGRILRNRIHGLLPLAKSLVGDCLAANYLPWRACPHCMRRFEDAQTQLADWTPSVAVIENKKKTKRGTAANYLSNTGRVALVTFWQSSFVIHFLAKSLVDSLFGEKVAWVTMCPVSYTHLRAHETA